MENQWTEDPAADGDHAVHEDIQLQEPRTGCFGQKGRGNAIRQRESQGIVVKFDRSWTKQRMGFVCMHFNFQVVSHFTSQHIQHKLDELSSTPSKDCNYE